MQSFAQKYPAFAALLQIAAVLGIDFAAPGASIVQKLEGAVNVVSPVVAFLPQASLLSAEIAQLKASPADMEAAAEALVSDLQFSSEKAKAIIASAFPLAESIVGLIPQVQAIVAAVQA